MVEKGRAGGDDSDIRSVSRWAAVKQALAVNHMRHRRH